MKLKRIFTALLLMATIAAPAAAFADDGVVSWFGNPLAYTAVAVSSFLRLPYCYMSVTKQTSSYGRTSLLSRSDTMVYPGDVLRFKWLAIGMGSPVLYHDGKPSGGFENIDKSGTKTLTVGSDIASNTGTGVIIETFQIGPNQEKALGNPSCKIEIKSLPAPTSTSSSDAMQTSSGQGNGTTGAGTTGTSGGDSRGINKIIKDKILNIVGGGGSGSGASGNGAGYSGGSYVGGGNSIQSTGGFFYLPVGNTGTGSFTNPFNPTNPGGDDSVIQDQIKVQVH